MRCVMTLLFLLPGLAFAGQWSYDLDTDPMTSKRTVIAYIDSDVSLALDRPYSGRNIPRIGVRQAPRTGLNVYLQIDKGQLICHFDECRVLVRFDDQPPTYFAAVGPADHSSTILFLSAAAKFVEQARKAKRIRVQANIFQEGAPIMEFTTPTALVWPWPPKAAAAAASAPARK